MYRHRRASSSAIRKGSERVSDASPSYLCITSPMVGDISDGFPYSSVKDLVDMRRAWAGMVTSGHFVASLLRSSHVVSAPLFTTPVDQLREEQTASASLLQTVMAGRAPERVVASEPELPWRNETRPGLARASGLPATPLPVGRSRSVSHLPPSTARTCRMLSATTKSTERFVSNVTRRFDGIALSRSSNASDAFSINSRRSGPSGPTKRTPRG